MRKTLSEKQIVKSSFYKGLRLTTVKSQSVIRDLKKKIHVEHTPWKKLIEPTTIKKLLMRLDDSPRVLYEAIERTSIHKFKFKQIYPALESSNEKMTKNLMTLKKVQERKRKYEKQYRDVLLNKKTISLNTDLPRIKYIKQNNTTDKINAMCTKVRFVR